MSGPSLWTLAGGLLALAANGCIMHAHAGRDRPGDIDVSGGHVTRKGQIDPPKDPGEDALVIEGSGLWGGTIGLSDDTSSQKSGFRDGMTAGFELSPMWLALPEGHDGAIAQRALKAMPLRPSVGWVAVRFDGDDARVGPLTAGIKWSAALEGSGPGLSLGGGAAVEWKGPWAGVYGSACFEPAVYLGGFCARATAYAAHGVELLLTLSPRAFFELTRSR